jgi:hypothetical protein
VQTLYAAGVALVVLVNMLLLIRAPPNQTLDAQLAQFALEVPIKQRNVLLFQTLYALHVKIVVSES